MVVIRGPGSSGGGGGQGYGAWRRRWWLGMRHTEEAGRVTMHRVDRSDWVTVCRGGGGNWGMWCLCAWWLGKHAKTWLTKFVLSPGLRLVGLEWVGPQENERVVCTASRLSSKCMCSALPQVIPCL